MSSLRDKRSSKTEAAAPLAGAAPTEVVIGRLVALDPVDGAPLVDFSGNPAGTPVRAEATARYDAVQPGAALALMFIQGDRARPLAIGMIATTSAGGPQPREADDRLTLTAAREVVLQCGRASIVLTRAGKVLVRGAYLSLRSTGMQRITGAAVHIN